MAAAQVGGKGNGQVRLRLNRQDADNSDTVQAISASSFTTVPICQGVMELNKGDKVEMVHTATTKGVGLVVLKPAGEPAVPSMILSKLD